MRDEQSTAPVDPARAARSLLVLRVLRVATEGGNKFAWDDVDVLKVFKGSLEPRRLRVAHYSWEKGIPELECTVYLEPYSDAADGLWKLLDGKAASGVSHVGPSGT